MVGEQSIDEQSQEKFKVGDPRRIIDDHINQYGFFDAVGFSELFTAVRNQNPAESEKYSLVRMLALISKRLGEGIGENAKIVGMAHEDNSQSSGGIANDFADSIYHQIKLIYESDGKPENLPDQYLLQYPFFRQKIKQLWPDLWYKMSGESRIPGVDRLKSLIKRGF